MAKEIPPLDKPSRRTLEQLFRQMRNASWRGDPTYGRHTECRRKQEEIEKKLLKESEEYQTARMATEEAWSKHHVANQIINQSVNYAHYRYLAEGITPDVLKLARGLADLMLTLQDMSMQQLDAELRRITNLQPAKKRRK